MSKLFQGLMGTMTTLALAGCLDEADAPAALAEEAAAETQAAAALACTGAACDGLPPAATRCPLDARVVGAAAVLAPGGAQLGTVVLVHSPACQTVWGFTSLVQTFAHRVCAVRRDPVENQGVCTDGAGGTLTSPMRHLAVGQSGFARTVLVDLGVAARTGDFTRRL